MIKTHFDTFNMLNPHFHTVNTQIKLNSTCAKYSTKERLDRIQTRWKGLRNTPTLLKFPKQQVEEEEVWWQ